MPRGTRAKPAAWVVAASMGLGHQRAAYPLRDITPEREVLYANRYPGIPEVDRKRWYGGRSFYETISRLSDTPLIGKFLFALFDQFQRIAAYYPRHRAERPSLQLRQLHRLIQRGWGQHLIGYLSRKKSIPLVATFFTPAFMAEAFNYPHDIYCVVTDTDIARVWAPIDAGKSRITYFASTPHAADRLRRYGVRETHIVTTGFPLPKENLGTSRFNLARRDLAHRIKNLDPEGVYGKRYSEVVRKHIGRLPKNANHLLTLLYSIGGAGAQRTIALNALRSLAEDILSGTLRFIVACGTSREAVLLFRREAQLLGITRGFEIVSDPKPTTYFELFNQKLRTTDVLWTKPSELSFYAGLGIPIIMAPPLGAHEQKNRDWLLAIGAGRDQEDPTSVHGWLTEWRRTGWLAEAAMQGFVEIEKNGTYAIEKIVQEKRTF